MSNSIPDLYVGSQALQFIQSRGWLWRNSNPPNVELEVCPYCNKDNYGHCYMELHGTADEQKNRDGLHQCHKCGKGGSLYTLKEHLGVILPNVQSQKDWAGQEKKLEELPDIDVLHQQLLEDAEAMDYLINGRGFSQDIIERQKLGLVAKRYFRECGEVRALAYPYLVNGNCVFVHFRTMPTMPLSENKVPKAFNSLTNWDAPLYNGEILREGLKEVFMVEGEANCIAAMDHGVDNIVGAPGANFKRAEWIDTLDKIGLEKIYICYDKDKVGQRAAQELASRIGVEKCWRISLPDFTVTTDEGETRPGKDLNEWFVTGGGTAEEFEKLKQSAVLFDVDGVSSSGDAADELYDEILGRGVEPPYKSPWNSLNKIVGFDKGDVIDIVAPEKVGKTTFGLNLMEHMVSTYREDGAIICLEMTRAKLVRKHIALVQQIDDPIPKTPEAAETLKQLFLREIPLYKQKIGEREGDLYFCYPKYKTMDDLYKLIIAIIRRYGVKWIMFDNVQRACDTTPYKNRTEHLSRISKVLSQIGKDYGVQMIRILQPHRIGEGKMVTTDNVDGSSQIAKDCDCMITIHRNRINQLTPGDFETLTYVESEQAFDNRALVGVGLSRYSSGGYTTLQYQDARSTVEEFSIGAIQKMKADVNKNVEAHSPIGQLQALGVGSGAPGEITI